MTPSERQVIEEGVDVDRGNARLAEMGFNTPNTTGAAITNGTVAQPRKRATRSDAGTTRKKEPPAQVPSQVAEMKLARLRALPGEIEEALRKEWNANRAVALLKAEYADLIDSLTRAGA